MADLPPRTKPGANALSSSGSQDLAEIIVMLDQLSEQNALIIEKLCPTKSQVVYVNSDNETEMTVSVGGNGDIKIDAGSGDGSEAAVVACIETGLAAGLSCEISWTTVDGGEGSATLLPEADTNAFPNFYNQTTDATGDSGKIATFTCG